MIPDIEVQGSISLMMAPRRDTLTDNLDTKGLDHFPALAEAESTRRKWSLLRRDSLVVKGDKVVNVITQCFSISVKDSSQLMPVRRTTPEGAAHQDLRGLCTIVWIIHQWLILEESVKVDGMCVRRSGGDGCMITRRLWRLFWRLSCRERDSLELGSPGPGLVLRYTAPHSHRYRIFSTAQALNLIPNFLNHPSA